MIAFVSAGEGAAPPLSSRAYQSRISAAMPETSGAACEVPETSEYSVLPAGNCGLHVPVPS